MKNWAILPIRIGLGVVFVAHGLQKVFGLFGGSGIQGLSGMLSTWGLPAPTVMAYLAAYTELLGGLFLILGFLTRISAFSIMIMMFVAIAKVHGAKGFFSMTGGFEYNFVLICMCLSLLASGPGKLGVPFLKKM